MQEGVRWSRTGSCWYLLVQESGRWFRTGSCWSLLVQEKWTLVSVGAEKWTLVSAGAGKRSLVQNWQLLVSAGARKWTLMSAGVCWCRKAVAGKGLAVAGAELVAASAGKWPPGQEW